ncbi:hypothetical protein IQ268_11105 [Oculatella sp. LEGE 06141]|uniref:hypothetical protein n=1 Tax=Oculatella sp. LEGE 06141 TaxID=1828648 RepID=UPI00187E519A|nr:hypothetical protein [Oculatella sp. LEGE 06141]MBE9179109.1 hypothetical protein [Oculatella sp. LEGE 06141]
MPWATLGTITPSIEWQTFNLAVTDTETFRIIQSWSKRPINACTIAQFFPTFQAQTGFRRIYPNERHIILDLRIPSEFRKQSIITRSIQIRRRLPEVANAGWAVEIQAFY